MRQPEEALPFSLEEYTERVEKVRAQLVESNLDALLVYWPENIYYLSGLNTVGYFSYQVLIVPVDREPFFVVRGNQRENALKHTVIEDGEVYYDDEDPVAATARALKSRGLAQGRLGVEFDGWFLTHKGARKLEAELNLIDASQIVNRVRLVKSPQEIEYMKAAVRAMEAGAKAGLAAIRPGNTENDVAGEVLSASVKAGSQYTGHAPLIATSSLQPRTFATWEGQRINAGDIMMFEPGASVKRYHGLALRIVSVGPIRDERLKRISEAGVEGFNAGIDHIKAGVTSHDVAVATREPVRRAGFVAGGVSRCGYSVGIGYPPDWGEGRTLSIVEGENTVLEANMTFHFQNSIRYEGVYFNIGETIRVTETGCEVLTTFLPRELIIV